MTGATIAAHPSGPSPADAAPTVSADDEGAQVRSRERHRRAAITAATAVAPKLLTVALLLLGSRAVAGALPRDGFGVWLLLVTASGLLGFADLGLGNGLLNAVATASGRDDVAGIRSAVSSASMALVVVAAALVAAFAATAPIVSWPRLLHVGGPAAGSAGPAVGAFVVATALSIAFGAAPRVRLALQTGWVTNVWAAIGGVVSLVAVLVAAHRGASLPVLVGAALVGAPLVALADTVLLFGIQRPDLRPRRASIRRAEAVRIGRQGAMFCFLGVAMAVGYESDALVISHYLGAGAVPQFALPYRIVMLAPSAISLLVAPLWPAYAEALARGDRAWAHRTLRRSVAVAVGGTVAVSALLVVAGPALLRRVTGDAAPPSRHLLAALGLLACVISASTAVGVFL
ncbi:MAG: polysaccharide biosynthesis protein, partial [Acidimicrobiales bacterium]|nr:polysaccharide biosynthesis protein [Acidimicrobiales bacterium]